MDSEAKIIACVSAAIRDVGLEPKEADSIRDIIGLGLHESIERLYPGTSKARHAEFAARYRDWFISDQATETALFPGASDTLVGLLNEGYRLAVATGKGRAGLDGDLASTGIEALFQTSRCADEAFSKPHPQMLLDIMDHLGVDAEHTVMIGDTAYDLEMARNAGTRAIAATYGAHAPERLIQFDPIASLNAITELPASLAELGTR